eukprot:evm.model.NODE_44685_length_7799_cov_24.510193.1
MGLGKTIQAIAIATVYRVEWPLLVMCPSSARFQWEAELLKWLDRDVLKKEEIQVMTAGKEKLHDSSKVVILSYDLALRLKDTLRKPIRSAGTAAGHRQQARFRVVVADECHYLKNAAAQRTKELLPLLAEATRAILLSGTPALSRPRELWTQLNVLNGKAWRDQSSFIDRYCTGGKVGGRTTGAKKKWQGRGQGAANLRELHEMLKATVMVRRRKKDILKGLPPKRRIFHKLAVPEPALREQLERALEGLSIVSATAKKRARKAARAGGRKKGKAGAGEDPDDLYSTLARQHRERRELQQQQQKQQEQQQAQEGQEQQGEEGGGGGDGTVMDATAAAAPAPAPGSSNANAAAVAGRGMTEEEMAEWSARDIHQRKKMILMEVFKLTGTAKIPLAIDRVRGILSSELG